MDNQVLINNFSKYLKSSNKTLSTIIAYKKDIEQLSESNVSKNLQSFNSEDIKHFLEFLKNNKISLKTISRKLNSIRTFYKYVVEVEKIMTKNPALEVSHPKLKNKRPRILTKYEYLALREVSRENIRLFTMIELLLQTGIRISEIANVKMNDIKLNKNKHQLIIKAYSNNSDRIVPLSPKAVDILNKYSSTIDKKNITLFYTKTGKPIEIRNIRSSIDRALSKAEIKNACVNDLRNTFIVHQLNNGMSLSRVAEIVGHRNVATTTKYLTLLDRKYKPSGIDDIIEL